MRRSCVLFLGSLAARHFLSSHQLDTVVKHLITMCCRLNKGFLPCQRRRSSLSNPQVPNALCGASRWHPRLLQQGNVCWFVDKFCSENPRPNWISSGSFATRASTEVQPMFFSLQHGWLLLGCTVSACYAEQGTCLSFTIGVMALPSPHSPPIKSSKSVTQASLSSGPWSQRRLQRPVLELFLHCSSERHSRISPRWCNESWQQLMFWIHDMTWHVVYYPNMFYRKPVPAYSKHDTGRYICFMCNQGLWRADLRYGHGHRRVSGQVIPSTSHLWTILEASWALGLHLRVVSHEK